jgi:hypothetical protein
VGQRSRPEWKPDQADPGQQQIAREGSGNREGEPRQHPEAALADDH